MSRAVGDVLGRFGIVYDATVTSSDEAFYHESAPIVESSGFWRICSADVISRIPLLLRFYVTDGEGAHRLVGAFYHKPPVSKQESSYLPFRLASGNSLVIRTTALTSKTEEPETFIVTVEYEECKPPVAEVQQPMMSMPGFFPHFGFPAPAPGPDPQTLAREVLSRAPEDAQELKGDVPLGWHECVGGKYHPCDKCMAYLEEGYDTGGLTFVQGGEKVEEEVTEVGTHGKKFVKQKAVREKFVGGDVIDDEVVIEHNMGQDDGEGSEAGKQVGITCDGCGAESGEKMPFRCKPGCPKYLDNMIIFASWHKGVHGRYHYCGSCMNYHFGQLGR